MKSGLTSRVFVCWITGGYADLLIFSGLGLEEFLPVRDCISRKEPRFDDLQAQHASGNTTQRPFERNVINHVDPEVWLRYTGHVPR